MQARSSAESIRVLNPKKAVRSYRDLKYRYSGHYSVPLNKMRVITVPNLNKYQHYKDRNIIWIKLYVDVLQDHKFQQLNDVQRWLFIALILLAVKNNNEIPADFHYISRNLLFSSRGLSENIIKLHDLKLIDIKRIASRKQGAIEIREDKIREDKKDDSVLNKFYKNAKEVIKRKTEFK